MRTENVWDKWMEYDEDEFCYVLRPDAPDEVKEAYEQHCAEMGKAKVNGYLPK